MREMLRRWGFPVLVLGLVAVITIGLVTSPPRPVDRVDALTQQLRCPVCQGESVADSPSDTARAIEEQVAELVAAGRTDREILDHYVARYGRWVLLDPPLRADTLALWVLPFVAVVAGVIVIASRRRQAAATLTPDDDERATLRQEIDRFRAEGDTR
jgi:cytochrome c-type biogenesis protein CcmH